MNPEWLVCSAICFGIGVLIDVPALFKVLFILCGMIYINWSFDI